MDNTASPLFRAHARAHATKTPLVDVQFEVDNIANTASDATEEIVQHDELCKDEACQRRFLNLNDALDSFSPDKTTCPNH
jgi:hypothetical protein